MLPKTNSRSKVKRGPVRDPKHLAYVRQWRCCLCMQRGPSEAHHIRECFPRTMGKRIGDDKTIPLCRVCHAHVHLDSRRFWDGLLSPNIDPIATAARMYERTLSLRGEANPKRSGR